MPSASYLARRFDREINVRGRAVSCYAGGAPPRLLGTTRCLFIESNTNDEAMLAGVDPNELNNGLFPSTAAALLVDRGYVLDPDGVWWLIDGNPGAQTLDSVPIGVIAPLVKQIDNPVGS